MRRTFAVLLLFTTVIFVSACGGGSDTSGNAGRTDVDTTVNSERIDSSNIAPTGGPGPEPEGRGAQSPGNANQSEPDNKNKPANKNPQ